MVFGGFEHAVGTFDSGSLGIELLPVFGVSGDRSDEAYVFAGVEVEGFSHFGGRTTFLSKRALFAASGGGADDFLPTLPLRFGAVLDQRESCTSTIIGSFFVSEQIIPDLRFALRVTRVECDDGRDPAFGIVLIDGLVIIGTIHCCGKEGQFGMLFLGVFQKRDSLGVIGRFS